MNRVDGKVAIVTGGESGIGKTSCEILAAGGAGVIVSDIDARSAEDTADAVIGTGGKAIAMQHDVTSEAEWQAVINFTLERFDYLDVLVNSAAIRSDGTEFEGISAEQWRNVLSVNLGGFFWGHKTPLRLWSNSIKSDQVPLSIFPL